MILIGKDMEVKYLKLWNQDEKDFQENAIRNEGIKFYYYIILGYAFSFICYLRLSSICKIA